MTTQIESTGSPQDYGFPEHPQSRQSNTWALQETFLAAFAETGAVNLSAAAAGHSVEAYHHWVLADTYMFQKRLELARERKLESMILEIDRRAFEGIEKQFFNSKGELTATQTQYSDNLAMFRVKKLDPSYRDAAIINVDASAIEELVRGLRGRQIEDAKALPPADTIIEHKPSGDAPPWSG